MKLKKGDVKPEQLELLIDLTSIRSDSLLVALKAYFCEGLTQDDAAALGGITQPVLNRRIKAVQDVNETVSQLSKYY